MTGAVRRGSGCATALGAALILVGGLALAINLAGARLALWILDLLPHLAVWWPAILILWGVWKVGTRLRTGRARFGFVEIVLLVLLVVFGTGLTFARRIIEGHDIRFRLTELSRWAEDQASPRPQQVFVEERKISVPTAGSVEIALELPRGGILVEAALPTEPTAVTPPASRAGGEPIAADSPAAEPPAAGSAPPAPREVRLTLTKRVWAENRREATSRAETVRLTSSTAENGAPDDGHRIVIGVEDDGDSEIALDLVVTAPPGVAISAVSGRGPIRIRGPFSDVTARGSGGVLEVEGALGEVFLSARDGVVWAAGIGGPLRIRGRRAVIEVESVERAVSVESDGAPVWIADAAGRVTVTGEDAPVEISEAVGPVEVKASIAPVSLRGIAREARVRSDYGPVLAASVAGALTIRAESAVVEVRAAGSGVDISQSGGILLVDGISGNTKIASGRSEVLASGLSGPVVIAADAGAVTVREFRGPLSLDGGDADLEATVDSMEGEISLHTGSGDIALRISAGEPFTLRVDPGVEEVVSDFELESVRESDHPGDPPEEYLVWRNAEAAGGPLVSVSTTTGEIVIRSREPR